MTSSTTAIIRNVLLWCCHGGIIRPLRYGTTWLDGLCRFLLMALPKLTSGLYPTGRTGVLGRNINKNPRLYLYIRRGFL
jgi:hypothetical protein